MTSKVVIVTGASRGIGLAAAHQLLKSPQSSKVVVLARTAEPLEDLKKQYPDLVEFVAGNVADPDIAKQSVDLAIKTWGRLDGLILNHGRLEPVARVDSSTRAEWRENFEVNFFSCVDLIKDALPHLRKSKGKIILVSSGAAVKGYPTWGAYGASKAAMNHIALTLQAEEPDVTTISIRPGVVDTQMQADLRGRFYSSMDKTIADDFVEKHASGSLLKPEKPGNVLARLVIGAENNLSGKYLSWNAEELAPFQD